MALLLYAWSKGLMVLIWDLKKTENFPSASQMAIGNFLHILNFFFPFPPLINFEPYSSLFNSFGMISPFSTMVMGGGVISFLILDDLRMMNIPVRYRTTNTMVVMIDPFKPSFSSDSGWARISPTTKTMAKSERS